MSSWRPKDDYVDTERLRMLLGFVGQDLVEAMRRKAMESMQKETLEIGGKLLGGNFKLTISFDNEVAH